MKLRFIFLLWCVLTVVAQPASAQPNIRVSVKFILDASGNRPSNTSTDSDDASLTSDQAVIDNIAYANELLARTGRGYQLQLTEIKDVSDWSLFFALDAHSSANKELLELTATLNATTRAQFFWRDNAINIYINNTSSGVCSFPSDEHAIFLGSVVFKTTIIHEVGHFFDLAHTHEGEKFEDADGSRCAAGNCTCAVVVPGSSDHVDDTLPDSSCFTAAIGQSSLAESYYGIIYNNLTDAQRTKVDDTYYNIMSYRTSVRDRFTSDQLDRWTDTANSSREDMVSGRTVFVDHDTLGVFSTGSSTDPYKKLANGIDAASDGDIVLIRPGSYNEPLIITKGVTLRATRGDATIGR